MTTPIALPPGAAPAPTTGGAHSANSQSLYASWLRQMEQAQWSAWLQHAPADASAGGASTEPSASSKDRAAPPAARPLPNSEAVPAWVLAPAAAPVTWGAVAAPSVVGLSDAVSESAATFAVRQPAHAAQGAPTVPVHAAADAGAVAEASGAYRRGTQGPAASEFSTSTSTGASVPAEAHASLAELLRQQGAVLAPAALPANPGTGTQAFSVGAFVAGPAAAAAEVAVSAGLSPAAVPQAAGPQFPAQSAAASASALGTAHPPSDERSGSAAGEPTTRSTPLARTDARAAPSALPGVRAHAQWLDNGALCLWLGVDAHDLQQLPQLATALSQWLSRTGVVLHSLVCNGQPIPRAALSSGFINDSSQEVPWPLTPPPPPRPHPSR